MASTDKVCYCEKYYEIINNAFEQIRNLRIKSEERLERCKLEIDEIRRDLEEAEADLEESTEDESTDDESSTDEEEIDEGISADVYSR